MADQIVDLAVLVGETKAEADRLQMDLDKANRMLGLYARHAPADVHERVMAEFRAQDESTICRTCNGEREILDVVSPYATDHAYPVYSACPDCAALPNKRKDADG